MKIIMNSRNYQILKTFIGKMSMELIDVNSVRKYTQIRGISEFVFPFYHAIFYDNKTFEHLGIGIAHDKHFPFQKYQRCYKVLLD